MADYTAYFNGEWVPYSQVSISPGDRGFTVGDVVFDVARTFNGKSYRMKEHIDRLYRSLNYIRLDPGLSADEMHEVSEEVIRRNEQLRGDVGDFAVRQFVTRGPGVWSRDAGPPTVCVNVSGINYDRFAHFLKSGAHGVIPRTRSYSSDSLDPKVKHYSRMNFNMADIEVGDVDPDGWPGSHGLRWQSKRGNWLQLFLGDRRRHPYPRGPEHSTGCLQNGCVRPGPAAGHSSRRGGASALRPLYCGRGFLLRHQLLCGSNDQSRQPAGGGW